MMTNEAIQDLQTHLQSPKKIVIIPHRNPDGDALGATLALWHYFKDKHNVVVMAPNEFPNFIAWLPGSNEVLIFEKETEKATLLLQQSDLIFTLDFNALHRVGDKMEAVLQTLTVPFVMIDHHQSPDDYATYQFSDTQYGSTCEMVYHFLHQIEVAPQLSKELATCIYTGIVTDSGSFRFPKTTAVTHQIVAHLITLGVANSQVHDLLFSNSSYNRLQLLGRALQNMQILPAQNTAYITLSQEDQEALGHSKGDTEGIVNYGLSIENVFLSAIFIENKEEGIIKISFRSQGAIDVNTFARHYFDGGGHQNAAGGKSTESLTATVQKFVALIQEEKHKLQPIL